MAIIQDRYLFSWKTFQDHLQTLGDLERFKLVMETMPDGKLMETLQTVRANGRNDHPIRAMWKLAIAVGRLRQEHPELMRSLVRTAA